MKVGVTELVEGQKKELHLEIEDRIETIDYAGDEISFTQPTLFKGRIYNANGDLYIQGFVESVVELCCHRCLKRFQQKIIGEVHEKLFEEDSPQVDIDEYFVIKNNMVDITKIMENTLVLSLPMKIICDEHCKGLCLVCGTDLNEHQCNCKNDEVDPRLAKLKDLLQQN